MPSRPDRQITGLKVFIHQTWAYETGNLKLANQARFATDAEMFAAVEERKIVIAAVNGVFGE